MANQRERHLLFGGKTIVFGGDWKQLLPVVVNASIRDQAEASFKKSPLMAGFKMLRLEKNMRVKDGESEFALFLKALGNGMLGKQWRNDCKLIKVIY